MLKKKQNHRAPSLEIRPGHFMKLEKQNQGQFVGKSTTEEQNVKFRLPVLLFTFPTTNDFGGALGRTLHRPRAETRRSPTGCGG